MLVEHSDSILIVIDVQEHFLHKLGRARADPLVGRIAWLVTLAGWLHVPIVVTAEELDRLGGPAREIAAALPPDTPVHDKPVFGLAGVGTILRDVVATGRSTAVLAGTETDVCVSQSALGLLDEGFRVVVVADATSSPGSAHDAGIARMSRAGAEIVTTKALFYEWTRSVETAARFRAEHRDLGDPPGIVL